MSHTIELSSSKTYIILKIVGPITRKTSTEFNLEAHELGKKLGIKKYLVDLTESRNTDSVANNYNFAREDMKKPGIDRTARAAILVDPSDRSHDFVLLASKNAGIQVSLFTDLTMAERYLKDG